MERTSRPRIIRQHESTEIPELYGCLCHEFLAVGCARQAVVGPMYLRLGDGWHRFYLDAGLLFWREGRRPDSENDLLNDETYLDWCTELELKGVAITQIKMHESALSLAFANGARVVLNHYPRDESTSVVQFAKPQPG